MYFKERRKEINMKETDEGRGVEPSEMKKKYMIQYR